MMTQDDEKMAGIVAQRVQGAGLAVRLPGEDVPLFYGGVHTQAAHSLLLYVRCSNIAGGALDLLSAIHSYWSTHASPSLGLKWLIDGSSIMDDVSFDTIIARHHALLQADGCIVLDDMTLGSAHPALALGVKGLLRLRLTVETAELSLPSYYGAVAPNALWRLVWALGSIKDAREEILIDDFYDAVISAEDSEVLLLDRLSEEVERGQVQDPLFGLHGFQFQYAYLLTPTCTVTAIESETHGTHIPRRATAWLDLHLVPDQEPEVCLLQLKRHLHARGLQDVQLHADVSRRPVHTALADPFVQLVVAATHAVYGQLPLIRPLFTCEYPLAPLRYGLKLPMILAQIGYQEAVTNREQSIAMVLKQINAVIERMS